MPFIIVACDEPGLEHGQACGQAIAAAGYQLHVHRRATWPIGDGLPALLGAIASQCDAAVAVISTTTTSQSWVARELAMESLYPTWFASVARGVDVPKSLLRALRRVSLSEQDIAEKLDALLRPDALLPTPATYGGWSPFDPAPIQALMARQYPDRLDLVRSLGECRAAYWAKVDACTFVDPTLPSAAVPVRECLVLRHNVEGQLLLAMSDDARVVYMAIPSRTPR